MRIHFLEPPVASRLSGGCLYNDQLAAALQHLGIDSRIDIRGPNDIQRAHADIEVIDSLWISQAVTDEQLSLMAASTTRYHLLAHYFPPANPFEGAEVRDRWLDQANRWLSICDSIIAVGEAASKHWRNAAPNSPVVLAQPAIEINSRIATLPRRARRWLTVSRLEPAKLPLELLTAMAALASLDFTWQIVGPLNENDAHLNACRRAIESAGLNHKIQFLGPKSASAIPDLLRASHAYLAPSQFESYGMATAEAIAIGLPTLAFDVGDAAVFCTPQSIHKCFAPGRYDQAVAQMSQWINGEQWPNQVPERPALIAKSWSAVAQKLMRALNP